MSPKKKKIKKGKKNALLRGRGKVYEKYAYILEFSEDRKLAYVIGDTYFHFLKVTLKTPNDSNLYIGKRVYVGKKKERDSVTYIQERLHGLDLPEKAGKETKGIITKIISRAFKYNEGDLYNNFLLFFNYAAPITLRAIDLSRRHAYALVVARDRKLEQRKRFADFSDIEREFQRAGIRIDRFYLADKIAERIDLELRLPEDDTRRLLLKFLENPSRAISDSHATI